MRDRWFYFDFVVKFKANASARAQYCCCARDAFDAFRMLRLTFADHLWSVASHSRRFAR